MVWHSYLVLWEKILSDHINGGVCLCQLVGMTQNMQKRVEIKCLFTCHEKLLCYYLLIIRRIGDRGMEEKQFLISGDVKIPSMNIYVQFHPNSFFFFSFHQNQLFTNASWGISRGVTEISTFKPFFFNSRYKTTSEFCFFLTGIRLLYHVR